MGFIKAAAKGFLIEISSFSSIWYLSVPTSNVRSLSILLNSLSHQINKQSQKSTISAFQRIRNFFCLQMD